MKRFVEQACEEQHLPPGERRRVMEELEAATVTMKARHELEEKVYSLRELRRPDPAGNVLRLILTALASEDAGENPWGGGEVVDAQAQRDEFVAVMRAAEAAGDNKRAAELLATLEEFDAETEQARTAAARLESKASQVGAGE